MPHRFVGLDVGKVFQKDFLERIEADISKPMMFIVKVNCAGDDPFADTLILNILMVEKETECIVLPGPGMTSEVVNDLLMPLGGMETPMRSFDAIGFSH